MLLVTDERFVEHDPGLRHPERPERLRAALAGVSAAGLDDATDPVAPREATRAELVRVHSPELIDLIESVDREGGGRIDSDTAMSSGSLDAALHAAGSVLTAVERLRAGDDSTAYCVVRPPGHHATPDRSMGFCLFNSIAVAAAALVDLGEQVAIVDIDAHHGNGTQDIFYEDPHVFYVSIHQWPLYPGTGALAERGRGRGKGKTLNIPLPPGATGDVALAAIDRAVVPALERFGPSWVLISAGYDGHRADPITDLGYSAGDYADMVKRLVGLGASGRAVVVLEGGYDLRAVRDCSAAVAAALVGVDLRPEPATSGGPGADVVEAATQLVARDDEEG